MKTKIIPFILLILLFAGCAKDDPNPVGSGGNLFSVTGTIKNNKQISIPESAKVIVLWGARAGVTRTMYIIGEGKINPANNTFTISYDSNMPDKALNDGNMGVGLVLLVEDPKLKDGDELVKGRESDLGALLGMATEQGIIFIKGDPDKVEFREWGKKFKTGFNLGEGVRKENTYDEFTPSTTGKLEIIIDDNLTWLNWT